MNRAIGWLAHNAVAANLLMVLIVASGLTAAATITEEVFPEIDLRRIRIEVPYLGAAPEEVESGVVVRIEEAIQNIDGVQQIVSTAAEGSASVIAELEFGADSQRVLDEVTNNVQAITTLPVETEKPIIREMVTRSQVTDIAIAGATDVASLKSIAEMVRDGLVALPEVGQVEIVSVPPYEISIEVSEVALRRHGLTFDQVANAVRRSSLDMPGGSVRTERGEILLRTVGQAYRGADYENLALWTRSDGSRLLLGDVAAVVDGFAETDQRARFDELPAVTVSVYRSGEQSALDVAAAVRDYVRRADAWLPEGITLTIWQDQSQVLTDRLAIMINNGAAGFVLVFVVLTLFLDMRLAFWVSLGIPIAFLGAFALMPGLGVSVNMVSCFAFILVLGIVVDDAIIVGENIHRHQESHGDGLRGAVDGAREIGKPVVYAVLTTAAAFLPLLFVTAFGQMFQVVPLVVLPCLLFSLLESLGILPAHLAHGRRRRRAGPWRRLQQRIAGGLLWFVRRVYEPALESALRWRYVTAALGLATLILTGGLALGGATNFQFAPSIENEFMTASITMPLGTPAEATAAAVAKFEAGAVRLRASLEAETGVDYFRHVATMIGDQPVLARGGGRFGRISSDVVASPHIGEVTIELAPTETRAHTSEQLGIRWRERTGPVPEAVAIDFHTSLLSTGEDVDVELSGRDLDRLRAAAEALKSRLAEYAGVYAVADSIRTGKAEMRLDIRPAAETLGLTLQDLGRQVRQAFYGEEAQRIQRGRDDIRVMVRYPREQRQSLGSLETMRVRTPDGGEVPFSQVALVEPGRGFASIRRIDRSRAVNVTASVDPADRIDGGPHRGSARAHPARHAHRVPGRVLQVQRYPGSAGRGRERPANGIPPGPDHDLRPARDTAAVVLAAAHHHGRHSLRPRRRAVGPHADGARRHVHDAARSRRPDRRRRERQSHHGRFHQPGAKRRRRQRQSGGPPAGRPAACPGRPGARHPPGWQPAIPSHRAHFADHFRGPGPDAGRPQHAGGLLHSDAASLAFGVLFATFITLFLVPVAYAILDDLQRLPRALPAALGAAPRVSDPGSGA